MKINRREAVVGMTTALVSPVAASMDAKPRYENDVFAHGVASGDPAADSVVLWTRVSGQTGTVAVDWVVATDPALREVVTRGRTTTSVISDYTVKVVPQALPAGAILYYGFSAAGTTSPTGRTRTLPTGSLDQLVIAVASCSNFPFGRFNGYQAIADDPDVDVVVHLGDYIYEYSEDGYGAADGRRLGRVHEPGHEIVTLSDYRTRHAQYKRDPGSLAMHAMHPLIPTWDDHESTNNPWSGGAQNHQDGEGDWLDRRSVSLRAYYEWMPVREPGPGEPPEQRRAHFSFGDLASLYMVETRHMARAEQVDFAKHEAALETPEAAAAFYDDVVGDASRRMISGADARFLRDGLAESVAKGQPWRVLANQIILAKVVAPDLDDEIFASALAIDNDYAKRLYAGMAQLGEVGLPFNMDAWDGYPAARERLYNMLTEIGARDLLAVTGDTHVFWQNRLVDGSGTPVGLELGTSGITSPSGFQGFGKAAAARLDSLIAARNGSVEWIAGGQRGFVRLTLRRDSARADYVALSTIETRNFKARVIRSVDIVRRDGTLDYS
ncbi:MAG: alkaline phosphatase D family protein [Pseudomonadota bacterium]